MEENTDKKNIYVWGQMLFKVQIAIMFFYGALRLIYTTVMLITVPDFYTFNILWSSFLVCILFVLSGIFGYREIRRGYINLTPCMILSSIAAVMSLYTTAKLFGFMAGSQRSTIEGILLLVWIILGVLPPILSMGSIIVIGGEKKRLGKAENAEIHDGIGDKAEAGPACEINIKATVESGKCEKETVKQAESGADSEVDNTAEDTAGKKPIGALKVFFKTIKYVFLRMGFSLFGIIAWLLIVVVAAALCLYWGMSLQVSLIIILFFAVVGFICYFVINSIGKTTFRSAQIVSASYAFQHDEFPKDNKKTPGELLKERFRVNTIFPMITITLDLFAVLIFKKKASEERVYVKKEWRVVFADFLAGFLTGLVPILGYCSMSWYLQHPEDGILKGACDGLYGVYKNLKKLLGKMIIVFLLEAVVLVLLFFGILIFYYSLIPQEITSAAASMGKEYENAIMIILAIVTFFTEKTLFGLIVNAAGMISVLKTYSAATLTNPPGTAPLYIKIMNARKKHKAAASGT